MSNHIAWNVRVHRADERRWNERADGELVFTGGQLTPRVEVTGLIGLGQKRFLTGLAGTRGV
ncbi:hypothetical protein QYZ45_17655 [Vibrio parahaemolyticus]|nr:hypothetical protein [Vibrio parahaemolyticus]